MASTTLNRIYADEMQNHPYGYAVYQPGFSSIIKPGAVGYFDPSGFWSPLVDLTDLAALEAAGLKPPHHALSAAPPQKSTWGPMTSKSVSGHNLDISAGTDPQLTGLPLTVSLQVKYTTTSSFGAVLVTTAPITHNAFYHSSPFSTWVADNAHALLSGDYKDDIHSNGLVVVTQTYTTPKCSLTAWTDSKSEVFLGFEGGIMGMGELKSQGGWYEGNSAAGWEKYEEQGGDQLVVFVGGLWFDCRRQGLGSLLHNDRSSREASPHQGVIPQKEDDRKDAVVVTDRLGETYHLQCKVWGKTLRDEEATLT